MVESEKEKTSLKTCFSQIEKGTEAEVIWAENIYIYIYKRDMFGSNSFLNSREYKSVWELAGLFLFIFFN